MSLWRKSAGYAIGRGIASAIVFLLLPLLTRLMSPEQFGTWQALGFWAAMVMVFVQFGVDQALFRFYVLDEQKRGKFLFAAFAVLFIFSIIAVVVAWFTRGLLARIILDDSAGAMLIFLTALWGISDGAFFTLAALFQARERIRMFVIADLMRTAFGYGFAIMFLVKGFGVRGVVASWIAAGFIAIILFLPELFRRCKFSLENKIFLPMLRYGVPLAISMFVIKIFGMSDRWLLAKLQDFSTAGAYSAAVRIAGIVAMAIVPIRYAWVARMFHMQRENTLVKKLPTIWRQLSGGMAIIAILVILLSPEIFRIMVAPGYGAGAKVIPILALAYFLDALVLLADAGIYITGKTIFVPMFTGFAAILNIALNIFLIPRFGIIGAAWAALAAYAVLLFLGWKMGQFLMPVDIPYRKVFASIFAVIAAAIVASSICSLAIRIPIMLMLCLAVLFTSAIDRDIGGLIARRKEFLKN